MSEHALTGFATGNRDGKPNQREQEIGTPDCLLKVVREAFGQEINLDPCANQARPIALSHYFGERYDTGKKHKDGTAKMAWRGDGLTSPWMAKTFFNPLYESLSAWLKKSLDECMYEQIGLFPVRPNRQWWTQYMSLVDAHAYLKPLKFEGFKQAFPAPLCLAYFGSRREEFENAVRVSGLATHISLGGSESFRHETLPVVPSEHKRVLGMDGRAFGQRLRPVQAGRSVPGSAPGILSGTIR